MQVLHLADRGEEGLAVLRQALELEYDRPDDGDGVMLDRLITALTNTGKVKRIRTLHQMHDTMLKRYCEGAAGEAGVAGLYDTVLAVLGRSSTPHVPPTAEPGLRSPGNFPLALVANALRFGREGAGAHDNLMNFVTASCTPAEVQHLSVALSPALKRRLEHRSASYNQSRPIPHTAMQFELKLGAEELVNLLGVSPVPPSSNPIPSTP